MWDIVKPEFVPDGSLRELHVAGATLDHWDRLLAEVSEWGWPLHFTVDGEARPLPERAREALALGRNGAALLAVQVGSVRLHCHFFGERQLSFDIDPREVSDAAAFANVAAFMERLGAVTTQPVVLTPEGGAAVPILSLDPATKALRYHEPA